ncbi:hypothetical protein DFQ29_008565 [Apophysomyces sp. BC1021]|nr:hypothetical protein DFQ29_008565 [Apophysomyces sp. BC1021]
MKKNSYFYVTSSQPWDASQNDNDTPETALRNETGNQFALDAIEEQPIALESSESSEQNQPVEVHDITDYELLDTFKGVSNN